MSQFISPQAVLHLTTPSAVSLKALVCTLFLFFNRATRVLSSGSVVATHLNLIDVAVLPLVVSVLLHLTCLCPGIFIPTRSGREPVIRAILHVLLLHALSVWLVAFALTRYATTASFLAVLLASHMCCIVRPVNPTLVPAQALLYGNFMGAVAYALPVLVWVLLPVLRVHELEAIVLLYVPEVLCFVFAYSLHLMTSVLHLVTVVAVEPSWRKHGSNP